MNDQTASAQATSPTFTIVLPTHNRAHLLPRAVTSVLAQTFTNYELLIVDDGSTDETPAVVSNFDDPRIVCLRLEQGRGVSAARNLAIQRAQGQYISFLDDDDEFLPTFLAEMLAAFTVVPPDVGAMFCWVQDIRGDSGAHSIISTRKPILPPDHLSLDRYSLEVLGGKTTLSTSWGFTVRPGLMEAAGMFDESLYSAVDWDIFIRLAQHCKFGVLPKPLVKFYHHGGPRLTDRGSRRVKVHQRILEKYHHNLRQDARLYCDAYCQLATAYYRIPDRTQARRALRNAFRRHPLYLKNWFVLLTELPLAAPLQRWVRRLTKQYRSSA